MIGFRGGVLGLVIGMSGVALADSPGGTGRVEDVDTEGRTAKVKMESGKQLELTPNVEVFRNGAQVSAYGLEPGDEVRTSYDVEGKLKRLQALSLDELPTSESGWDAPKGQ